MAITIYSWQNYKWVKNTGITSLEIIQPTYNHNTMMLHTELVSGSVDIQTYFIDNDIPDNKFFKFSRLNGLDEVMSIIIKCVTPDLNVIPIPNEYNYDTIKIKIISTSDVEAEFNCWIKPASRTMRGIK